MAKPLLTTKLFIPPAPAELVSRPRLLNQLDTGVQRRLTMVSAPAGFGKTTLLSEWVHHIRSRAPMPLHVAWVSLDRGDNDPVRFWAYCVAALQTIPSLGEVGVGETILAALQSPGFAQTSRWTSIETSTSPDTPSAETLLTPFINEIAAIDPDPFVLILDDYHLIESQSIHNALTYLLDYLPPQMHLVIGTRADPPLSIARLRGRGQLTELRLVDLRFTSEEAAEFLKRVLDLDLSANDITALVSRTEGWIAGLQMAALSMQEARWTKGPRDVSAFIQAFTGSDRFILDYLVEEVLDRLPPDTQRFLLQTSVLDRLTASLCDAIAAREDSQTLLVQLERANLFLIPLDTQRRWYRYHRLFADLLRKRLRQAQPDLVPDLHRRASAWCEGNGLMAEAIDHALAAEDFERAADLVEQTAEATFMRSEVATFLGWVEALPDELVRTRPTLYFFHAWALLWSGQPLAAIEARLRDATRDAELMPGRVAALQAFVASWQGQVSRAAELSRRALEDLPEDEPFLRSVAAWNLGISYILSGNAEAGARIFGEVAEISQETGNVLGAVMTLCHLAELRMSQGQLYEARNLYLRALELATDERGRPLPIAGAAQIGLGELSREWNDLEAAERYLAAGIERVRQWGEAGALDGYIALARVRQAQGNLEGVRDVIGRAHQVASRFDVIALAEMFVTMYQVRLWIMQGKLEAAVRWFETQGQTVSDALSTAERLAVGISPPDVEKGDAFLEYQLHRYEHVLLARLLLAQDRPDEALTLLEPQFRMIERQGWIRARRTIELQILRALAFQAKGDVAQALTTLENALSIAEPGGFVRIFADEGKPMARLLRQAASRGIAPAYVARLLTASDGATLADAGQKPTSPPAQPLIEPLSERELEVLRLLSTGRSNPEIAEELFIAVSTVRSHLKNIYSKLNVHKRWDAVRRAEEFGLL